MGGLDLAILLEMPKCSKLEDSRLLWLYVLRLFGP